MADASSKPSVLIFGRQISPCPEIKLILYRWIEHMFQSVGCVSCAFGRRASGFSMFPSVLSNPFIHSTPQYLRIVDKYSVYPPTTYVVFFPTAWDEHLRHTIATSVCSSPKSLKSLGLNIDKSTSPFHVRWRCWTTFRGTFILSISEYLIDLWSTDWSF